MRIFLNVIAPIICTLVILIGSIYLYDYDHKPVPEHSKVIFKTLSVADSGKTNLRQYSEIIASTSKTIQLDWKLIAATIAVESEFNPRAINLKSNCKGLMQLKESTAKNICLKIDEVYIPDSTIWIPEMNIKIGSLYLKQYSGDGFETAIKSYVGGPRYKESEYVQYYFRKIWSEYLKLTYIEQGMLAR